MTHEQTETDIPGKTPFNVNAGNSVNAKRVNQELASFIEHQNAAVVSNGAARMPTRCSNVVVLLLLLLLLSLRFVVVVVVSGLARTLLLMPPWPKPEAAVVFVVVVVVVGNCRKQ